MIYLPRDMPCDLTCELPFGVMPCDSLCDLMLSLCVSLSFCLSLSSRVVYELGHACHLFDVIKLNVTRSKLICVKWSSSQLGFVYLLQPNPAQKYINHVCYRFSSLFRCFVLARGVQARSD